MSKSRVFGVMVSLAVLCGLIYWLNVGSHYPVIQWPYEAYQGVAFFFAWALGVPESLSYVVAAGAVIIMLSLCFWVGQTVFRLYE